MRSITTDKTPFVLYSKVVGARGGKGESNVDILSNGVVWRLVS
ncbi:MAG: hypothetical protein AAF585_16400 [Verrucomicrobiota bacterium]